MSTKEKVRLPGKGKLGKSLEVRHARRGVGLMLRRGLHGAKNWVLEPEQDGTPRGPGGKAMRAAVVLAPAWVVLSAVTGGPERGGQQPGVFRAVMMALVVALVELAWFSARERKAGREEPWLKLSELDTESDESEEVATVEPSSEAATVPFEKAQVSEVGPSLDSRNIDDEKDEKGEYTEIDPPTVRQTFPEAISVEPKIEAAEGHEAPGEVLHEALHQATTEGANEEESGPVSSDSVDGVAYPFETLSHEATPETAFSLVKPPATPLREESVEAVSSGAFPFETGITESDEMSPCNTLEDAPTVVLRKVLQDEGDATEEPQVNGLKGALQQPLPIVLEADMVPAGPYVTGIDPVAEDWWLVKPDEPEEDVAAEPEPEPAGEPEPEPQPEPEPGETGIEVGGVRLPDVVVRYLAVQGAGSASEQDRDNARLEVVRWARAEIDSHRISQAEVARMLGVNRSTVSRWLDADPWATPTGE